MMALLKTNDAVIPLFLATVIIALVLSLYFVQGNGQPVVGTWTTLFLSFYMSSAWVDFDHYFSHVTADCNKMEGCTLDKCQQLCVSLGHISFTTYCFILHGVPSCCCEYRSFWSSGMTVTKLKPHVEWSNWK
jgi:hypothetical protein